MAVRRFVATAGAAGLAATLLPATASAQTPEVFSADASGQALGLEILGGQAGGLPETAIGLSGVGIGSSPTPSASARSAGIGPVTTQTAGVTGSGTDAKPRNCPAGIQPGVLGLLSGDVIPCAGAISASVTAGNPSANAVGEAPRLGVRPFFSLTVGNNTSTATTTAAQVTSKCTADGTSFDFFSGLLIVSAAPATVTATYDRASGVSSADANVGGVRVQAPGLPPPLNDFVVPPGETRDLVVPELGRVTVVGARKDPSATDGTASANAGLVTIEFLRLSPPPDPTYFAEIDLGSCQARVAGRRAVAPPPTTQPQALAVEPFAVEPFSELPRTGGGPSPWIPAAGFGILALAFLGRRLSVKAR